MNDTVQRDNKTPSFVHLGFVYLAWILATEAVPMLYHPLDPGPVMRWMLAALRMAVLLLLTYAYIRFVERSSFLSGFNLSLNQVRRSLLWAVVFFFLAGAVLMLYQFLIVRPLTEGFVIASSGITSGGASPFRERLVECSYIVFEEIVEVLIFIGFLLDRLARRMKLWSAILLSNVGYALWHYSYLSSGLLEGSLMIILTLLAGIIRLAQLRQHEKLPESHHLRDARKFADGHPDSLGIALSWSGGNGISRWSGGESTLEIGVGGTCNHLAPLAEEN